MSEFTSVLSMFEAPALALALYVIWRLWKQSDALQALNTEMYKRQLEALTANTVALSDDAKATDSLRLSIETLSTALKNHTE